MGAIALFDWIVIVVYLLGITGLGLWASKKVHSSTSLFIGDRQFGKWMMTFHSFGTGTHSDQAVGVAAKAYTTGASGIWYQWLWLFVTPFYWLIAPIFRRMRAVTVGEYFEVRYGSSVAVLFAAVGMLQLMFSIGLMLKGSSAMIGAISGGQINPELAIGAMTIMFVTYGVVGGLSAAIITDFVQGVMTIVLSFLLLPFALDAVGGLQGLRTSIEDPTFFELVAPGEIGVFFVAVIAFNALIGWGCQPTSMGMCAAGKSEMEGRVGVTAGVLIKRVCTIAWVLTGLCAVALYKGQTLDVDHVYGQMAHDLFPIIGPGLIGLFLASMLASVMSSCDSLMIASSALFTQNIYRKLIAPEQSETHFLWVGRIASFGIVLVGVLFAFSIENVVSGLETFWKLAAMMGVAFWIGLFWRRATPAGAWAGTLVSFATLLLAGQIEWLGWDFDAQFAHHLPGFMLWEGKLYLPWQMIMYLTTGLIAFIMVSLKTAPMASESLDRFYACLRTPIQPWETETTAFTLPEGLAPEPRRSLVDHPDFEIPRPSVIGMLGFFGAWIAVGVLMASFIWLLKA
ncbi:MAG: sodium:solute symporter family protein [Candidatus Latescibacterota bacterium]|nr:sodium:solute symporter family protein [Candidatus Latescibacterota bacterium]MEE3335361.1 sodium:solute symporter family protein [Candidatus Latescibacterota bacterium]